MTTPGQILRVATVSALDAIPGLVHGFEQRIGPVGGESREAGRRRLAQALAPEGRLLFLRQVHGTAVHVAPWDGTPEGDAAVAAEPGLLLGIETADCLPVLLVDPRRRLVAAAHAGWRGAAAAVPIRALESLLARGSNRSDLVAALGPAIGPCCYEVGDELRAAFGQRGEPCFAAGPGGRPHLDLRRLVVRDLLEAGLATNGIHHVADCTACRGDLYHSYRRDGPAAGRMVSYVGWSTARQG